jgi:hypothetical protein
MSSSEHNDQSSVSPMTNHHKIDFVAFDKKTDRIILSLVETRPWGDHGKNISDLHEKLNTYLNYLLGEQIWRDYPAMRGKRVALRLQAAFPLTDKEEQYILNIRKRFLDARNIGWETTMLQ